MSELLTKLLLLLTGLVTCSSATSFFKPELFYTQEQLLVLRANPLAELFARHRGLVVFSVGLLLLYAAFQPNSRRTIVFAALLEKAGLVYLLVQQWSHPLISPLHMAAYFDSSCVVLYSLYLVKSRH